MKKKVIFKTKVFPTLSETFVVSNVVEAIKNRFEVGIITDKKKEVSQSSQLQLLEAFSIPDKVKKYTDLPGKSKRYLKALVLLAHPILLNFYIKYARFKKKNSLSLLFLLAFYLPYRKSTFHVHFANALAYLPDLKKIGFLRSKIIVTFHGYDAYYLPTGKALKKLVDQYVKYVDHITVNSEYLKQVLVAKGFPKSKLHIVPIGIDTDFFKRSSEKQKYKESLKLITVARLVELKGIEYGIRTIKKLIDKGHTVSYSIIGEGPEEEQLKTLTRELRMEKHIHFFGKKSQLEIKNLLENHHVFLMTSTIDKDGRREAFGVVSLEAQAMELPVIGFKSGGFPETLVDGVTGFLVEDKDIEAMAASVEQLIKDKKLLQKMGRQARVHIIENFSFEKTTKKYLELY